MDLTLELVLSDDHTRPINARGTVTWIRPRKKRLAFYPKMGVQFTYIADDVQVHIVNMVTLLNNSRSRSYRPARLFTSHPSMGLSATWTVFLSSSFDFLSYRFVIQFSGQSYRSTYRIPVRFLWITATQIAGYSLPISPILRMTLNQGG